MKLNCTPDATPTNKYRVLQNVRGTNDDSLQTRPGLTRLFATDGVAQTDIRALSALGTDNKPRYLSRGANDKIWLDNGGSVATLASASPKSLGASMIPFRPNQSPNPYMYIANGSDYQKLSAPTSGNAVTTAQVGMAEPQSPPDATILGHLEQYVGQPSGGTITIGGTASGLSTGARVVDNIQGVFIDPASSGTLCTIQVGSGASLATAVYLYGSVNAYFFPANHAWNGGFGYFYPLNTGTAAASAIGNSLMFNPPALAGPDPNVQPMQWATINASGAITGYTTPWAGATEQYDMVVQCQIFVPQPGNYTININHDDGMIFAIQGAAYVSGPRTDGFVHTQTAVGGYQFSNGGIAGNNNSGNYTETYVVNFPTSGVYSMEIDYAQWYNEQNLNVLSNGANIFMAAGAQQSYQKGMSIIVGGGQVFTVQDVFPPLPQSLGIAAIYYYSGSTGRCVVVPTQLGTGPGNDAESIYTQALLSGLRRGALVQIGTEICYVLNVTTGPDGTVCFETTTASTHTTADQLSGVPGIQIFENGTLAVNDPITSPDSQFTVGTGIGDLNVKINQSPFVSTTSSFQPEDYIHFSVNVDNLANLNELKLLIDVGDGTFTQNFYYYSVRPSDIAAGVANTLTQLGAAQLVTQRAVIDEEKAAMSKNQGVTDSSAQTSPGSSQWSEIIFPISALTRVGNDQTKTLQNANAFQVLVNASGTVNIISNSISILGGYASDVGIAGAPYMYRLRPRSSVTGVKGNPSPAMRYGVTPLRQQVQVVLPATYSDPQMDRWDVFRYGGSLTSWRFAGEAVIGATQFLDIYGDDAISAGEALDFDNFEPWPTIQLPFSVAGVSVKGTTARVTVPAAAQSWVGKLLPGNEIKIQGLNVYTLWTRPTFISGSIWLFQFQENAGVSSSATLNIYEPTTARQFLPYMWGPDATGTVFAVGDPNRAGTLYYAKNNNPDAAPDTYNQELVQPSEPLMGGEIVGGVARVASTEQWWSLYPNQGNPLQRYTPLKIRLPRGLAAPFGHCNDGSVMYWWAKDGIWSETEGSLTDEDLYPLFPHEGTPGVTFQYAGATIVPPDYSKAASFRLAKVNHYLYATYQDSIGIYRQLTYDTRTKAWHWDVYGSGPSVVYHPEQQEGPLVTTASAYETCVMGLRNGVVAKQTPNTNDDGNTIVCQVSTGEWSAGDIRGGEQWGDAMLDVFVASANGMTVTPYSESSVSSPANSIGVTTFRTQELISLQGGILQNYLGLTMNWTDDFATQSQPTQLFIWQPTYIPKPEEEDTRFTDWMDVEEGRAGWVQGFVLHADTFNAIKGLQIRDSDTLQLHSFSPSVQHNGESIHPYSFNTPFIAHQIRMEPTDTKGWRFFDAVIVAEPTPESAETWQAQGTSFGLTGFMHIKQVSPAYASTQPVTLTITSYDGQSPAVITLPSTGGAFQKATFILTANKGMLYFLKATCSVPFQLYLQDWEILIGSWGRNDGYLRYASLGGNKGDKAKI